MFWPFLKFDQFVGEIQIVPADDAVLDESVAGFGDLLFCFFSLAKPTRITHGNGFGKTVGQFDFVKLCSQSDFMARAMENQTYIKSLPGENQSTIQARCMATMYQNARFIERLNVCIKSTGDTINLKIRIFSGVSDVSAKSKANLTGTLNTRSGSWHVLIKNENNTIQISNQY